MATVNFQVRNRMSVEAFKEANGAKTIDFFRKSNGKCFFICGESRGYVSPKVAEMIETGGYTADDFQYAECCMEGSNLWVPTIMRNGAEQLGSL